MKKYLVLGSEGQVGTPLCKHLAENGHTVHRIDIKNDSNTQDIRKRSFWNNLHCANINYDFVYFLAWDVGGAKYLQENDHKWKYIQSNLQLLEETFTYLAQSKLPFIFTTSQMSNMNHTSYGLSKALGEKATFDLGGMNVKLWNVYGIEHDPEKTHVITDFIQSAINTNTISCRTSGNEQRQFLHVDDLISAFDCVEQNYDKLVSEKKIADVTSFEWNSIKNVAQSIRIHFKECFNEEVTVSFNENQTDTLQQDIQNVPNRWFCEQTGWSPKVSLHDGIGKVLEHYTENSSRIL